MQNLQNIYDKLKAHQETLLKIKPTDVNNLLILTKRLKNTLQNSDKVFLGSVTLSTHLSWVIHHLEGLIFALKSKSINEAGAKKLKSSTLDKMLRICSLLKDKIAKTKNEEDLINKAILEIETEKPEVKKEKSSLKENKKSLKKQLGGLKDLVSLQVKSTIEPVGSNRPKKGGVGSILHKRPDDPSHPWFKNPNIRPATFHGNPEMMDQEMLKEQRLSDRKFKELEDNRRKKLEDELKLLQKLKKGIPSLGSKEYKLYRCPIFIPGMFKTLDLDKLKAKYKMLEGGVIIYDQLLIIIKQDILNSRKGGEVLQSIIDKVSRSYGHKYVDARDGVPIVSPSAKSGSYFIWIMESSELAKLKRVSLDSIPIKLAFDIIKPPSIGRVGEEIKKARLEIENVLRTTFDTKIKSLEGDIKQQEEKLDKVQSHIEKVQHTLWELNSELENIGNSKNSKSTKDKLKNTMELKEMLEEDMETYQDIIDQKKKEIKELKNERREKEESLKKEYLKKLKK